MKTSSIGAVSLLAAFALGPGIGAAGQTDSPAAPGFHHLHLNSMNPDAAIAFYTRAFPTTSKATWSGLPALKSPNNVLVTQSPQLEANVSGASAREQMFLSGTSMAAPVVAGAAAGKHATSNRAIKDDRIRIHARMFSPCGTTVRYWTLIKFLT